MEIDLNNQQICCIIERVYQKFKPRIIPHIPTIPKHKKIISPTDIILIKAYILPCIYSNGINTQKENLVIKYSYNKEIINLNILLANYKDLL
tara:strand:- start:381 stop:656 length:276 start_codon:yes stop_codon:yes gene_type:complete